MKKIAPRVLLSTVWIFLSVNYIYCDIINNMDSDLIRILLDGGPLLGMPLDQKFFLMTAVFMEIPFSMILLARVLNYRWNRWANIIAGTIMTLAQSASLFVGELDMHYTFYSVIEIAAAAFIVWYAWKWKAVERGPARAA